MDFATAEIKPEPLPKTESMYSLDFKICSQLQLKTMRVAGNF